MTFLRLTIVLLLVMIIGVGMATAIGHARVVPVHQVYFDPGMGSHLETFLLDTITDRRFDLPPVEFFVSETEIIHKSPVDDWQALVLQDINTRIYSLYLVDGAEQQFIADDVARDTVRWSPNGQFLYFFINGAVLSADEAEIPYGLQRYEPISETIEEITSSPYINCATMTSEWCVIRKGTAIHLLNLNDGSVTELMAGGSAIGETIWSPNGTQLLFYQITDSGSQIYYVYDPIAQTTRTLAELDRVESAWVGWYAHFEDRVVVIPSVPRDEVVAYPVYVLHVADARVDEIRLPDDFVAVEPELTVSLTDPKIAVRATNGRQVAFFAVDIAALTATRFYTLDLSVNALNPVLDWSPDGKWFSLVQQTETTFECARFWIYRAEDMSLHHTYSLKRSACNGLGYFWWKQ